MRIWLTLIFLGYLFVRVRKDGGKPEYLIASAFIIGFFAEVIYNHFRQPDDFRVISPVIFAIDFGMLIWLLWVSLRANRWWPLWISALQLIILSAHFAAYIKIPALRGVYWAMTALPNYPQYLICYFGMLSHARRKRRFGEYPDWLN